MRAELERRGLDGFVVPRADRHQNEYLPPSEERLAWLTGFTGSAGAAIVLADRAALFVDGRYTLQARDQIDTVAVRRSCTWSRSRRSNGSRRISKPARARLRSVAAHRRGRGEARARPATAAGATLVPASPTRSTQSGATARPRRSARSCCTTSNLPARPRADKLARIRAEIAKLEADALVVSDPHAVAWTFNIRGADVAHTPLPLAFAIVPREGRAALYIDGRKLANAVRDRLEELADVREPAAFAGDLAALGAAQRPCGSTRRPPPTRWRASSRTPAAR